MKIGKIFTVLRPVLSALIAIYLLSLFNLVDYVSIVPEDIKFETGLTIYFAIVENILFAIKLKIKENYASEITCIFYKEDADISNKPVIKFDENDVCQVKCVLDIRGNNNILGKSKIRISLPRWVDVQFDEIQSEIVKTEERHECLINLNHLVTNDKKARASASCQINLAMIALPSKELNTYTGTGKIIVKETILGKLLCDFKSNSFELRNSTY